MHTVQFSNHTGYGDWAGNVFGGAAISALIAGVTRRGVLSACDAVLSGYLGGTDTASAILEAVQAVKRANTRALYCCDPVIGDDGAVYVRDGISEFLRAKLLPVSDIATPNSFELSLLTGGTCTTLAAVKQAVTRLHAVGPRTVLVTGLRTEETPPDALDLLVGESGTFHLLRTPLLPVTLNGAGDMLAALFLYHWLTTADAGAALERAGSSLFGVIRLTAEQGGGELAMIAAQEELIRPSRKFTAESC